MESGDGLIVRLKIPLGIVDVALALDIAEWSRRWGSGVIELSARGNLQLRGISQDGLPGLQAALSGTDFLDTDVRGEAVRNISISPLSDIDPDAVLNVHPIARDLDRALRLDRRLHDLPGKFGFAIDAGGSFGTAAADITFIACGTENRPDFAVRLAGDSTVFLGPCVPDSLAEVAASVGLVFLEAASRQGGSICRMRDLVAQSGAAAIAKAAGLGTISSPAVSSSCIIGLRSEASGFLGLHSIGSSAFVGVGLPFGQISAKDFTDFAQSAAACGAKDLRLTPWRAIFVPLPSLDVAIPLLSRIESGPLILDPADPRRRVAACSGAPKCWQASTPARDDAAILALRLASHPGSGVLVHISGCEKGCAHPVAAPYTLIGRGKSYDLVLNGTASHEPVLEKLTLAQAVEIVVAKMEGAHR